MPIGILFGEMPRMVRDVVGSIVEVEPDLFVIADSIGAGALLERVELDRPAVVMLWEGEASQSPPAMCEELLGRFPRLTVIALEDRGQRASIYTLRPTCVRLAEISMSRLVSAIRRAAEPVPFPASVHDTGALLPDAPPPRQARS